MGAVAWAIRQRSVSHPRSSNRTCGFPASGSPTGFIVRHTKQSTDRKRPLCGVLSFFASRHSFLGRTRMIVGVCRLIANHHHLAFFESTPEVRALPSASITRLQRSYDPVRLPPMPPPEATLRPLPSHQAGLPRLPEPPFRRAVPTTPADRAGAHVDCFPASRGLPLVAGGSASALSLSRPAQASLTLRPAGLLSRPQATFVTRLQPMRLPESRSSATGSIDNSPGEFFLH
jgi:hypothetical protein